MKQTKFKPGDIAWWAMGGEVRKVTVLATWRKRIVFGWGVNVFDEELFLFPTQYDAAVVAMENAREDFGRIRKWLHENAATRTRLERIIEREKP